MEYGIKDSKTQLLRIGVRSYITIIMELSRNEPLNFFIIVI